MHDEHPLLDAPRGAPDRSGPSGAARPVENVSRDETTWTIQVVLTVLLAVVAPLVLAFPVPTDLSTSLAIGYLITVISAIELARLIALGAPRYVELTFWIYAYVWAGISPIAQIAADDYPWPGQYSASEADRALLLSALGLGCWVVGKRVGERRRGGRHRTRTFDDVRISRLAAAAVVLGVSGIALIGLGSFFSSRLAISRAWIDAAGGSVAISSLLRAIVSVPAALAVYLLLLRRRVPRRPLVHRLLLATLVAIVAIVANPVTSPRFIFGSFFFAWSIALVMPRSRSAARVTSLIVLVAVVVLFPIADVFRRDTRLDATIRFDAELFQTGDYDSLQQTMNGFRLVSDEGFADGLQAVGIVTFWVPRSVWPSKPEPVGIEIAEHAGYSFTNLASPFWIEGYLDFGILGTVALGVLLGWVAGRLERAWLEDPFGVLGSVVPLYAAYQLILLRGAIMAVISHLLIWSALTFAVSRRTTRAHETGTGTDPLGP